MKLAPPRHVSLARLMADKGAVWDRIVAEHKLQPHRYKEIARWGFGHFVFASDYDIVSDTSEARGFGSNECVYMEEMFLRLFAGFRRSRIIP
jgi:hypothetical protein